MKKRYLYSSKYLTSELKKSLSIIAVLKKENSELKEVNHYIGVSEKKLLDEINNIHNSDTSSK